MLEKELQKKTRRKFHKKPTIPMLKWNRWSNVQFYKLTIFLIVWWFLGGSLMILLHSSREFTASKLRIQDKEKLSPPRTPTFSNFAVPPFPPFFFNCNNRSRTGSASLQTKATVVVSLYNVQLISHALYLFQRVLKQIPEAIVNDVIVTADDQVHAAAKEKISDAVSLCDTCRVFFLDNNVYDARVKVARLAHNQMIVFMDARVLLRGSVVEDLVELLRLHPRAMISPQLRLFDAKRMITNVGVYRSGLTWALQAVRTHVEFSEVHAALGRREKLLNQTVVQREMFAVTKAFFREASESTRFLSGTTGSHVLLSLRALEIGGNILTSICSEVYLEIHDKVHALDPTALGPERPKGYTQMDFFSPTFKPETGSRKTDTFFIFNETGSKLNDPISALFRVVKQPSVRSSSLLFYLALSVNSRKNLSNTAHATPLFPDSIRRSLQHRQPAIFQRPKCSRFLGYMRSMDGMYALGMDKEDFPSPLLILTRNSSLWLGPIAFTGKHLQVKNSYVTSTSRGRQLFLSDLSAPKAEAQQFYLFQDQLVTMVDNSVGVACAEFPSNEVSALLYMLHSCPRGVSKFKFDVEFKKDKDCHVKPDSKSTTVR